MSVFDGEIDFDTVYKKDFAAKKIKYVPKIPAREDSCLILGVSRDAVKVKKDSKDVPDTICPMKLEYYKDAVERLKERHPRVVKTHELLKDIDPTPIENEIQDLKRTEYLIKYCSRELPFMSINLARRAKALQTLRLPDDVHIPDTTYTNSYRLPSDDKYAEHPSSYSLKPKFDNSLQKELRRILRINTGETSYEVSHGLLGKVVLEKNPFGPPREEPKYGRWKNQYVYTYRL